MSNGHDSADNVVSMDHLRRSRRRRNRRKIRSVPASQVREDSSARRSSVPSWDARGSAVSGGKVAAALAAAFVIVAAFLFAAVMLTGFFDVQEIELVGIEEEHREELLARAGLSEGMNILAFSANAVQEAVNQDPGLRFVSVTRVFPDRLVLSVERRGAVCSVYHLGSYVKLDREYQVLGLEASDTSMGQYPVVHGLTLGASEVGQLLEFENVAQQDAMKKVIEGLREANALQYIQQIHFTNLSEIVMLADYDIQVDVGNYEDMEIKATWISYMIPRLIQEGYRGGTLYVSGGRNASYSPETSNLPSGQDEPSDQSQAEQGSVEPQGTGPADTPDPASPE